MVKPQRFLFVDGLRGLAALSVVLFHFLDAVNQTAQPWIWPALERLFSYGYLGVDVFFVISGFVIPFSVRNAEPTPGFLLRFGVRRSIRLDPPYWFTILLELCAIKLGLMLFPALGTPFPSLEQILTHFVYAQEILGHGSIVAIFWTLCYEVQFYLVFVGALVMARSLAGSAGPRVASVLMTGLGAAAFLLSVTIFFTPVDTPLHGLFIDRWYQFFLGYLAMRCYLEQRISPGFIAASVLILAGSLAYLESAADNGLSALCIAWLLVAAARRHKMSVWLARPVSQFMGRISYSLYLVHPVIGWRLIKLLHELNGAPFTAAQAWLALAAGVAASVASAWLMYRLIEAPSLRICHEIRLDRSLRMTDIIRGVRLLRRPSLQTTE